ncbi:hypothetical protein LSH36_322g00022 [Paralvinella palmiformis]|uniref:Uncharacterized protein n=1 Tax=Paralvinella palmiformis TaxID=53620 RepID=A0AAD9N0W6_9ANNE|nr:hypothetical protein LSH36_322g00022 [Paralvinella palmiformis]
MVRSMELSWILLFITAWHHIIGIGAMYPDKKMQYGPGSFGDDTPQFLLFTYSGNLTMKTRELLAGLFPDTYRNPNGCPIGITLFIVSHDANACSVHRMYTRGHEIALSGLNYISRVDTWNKYDWKASIKAQQLLIVNASKVDQPDIVGMRAQRFFPGNNEQFEMLNENHFVYDSSLLIDPDANRLDRAKYIWPFLMNKESLERISCQAGCPNKTFHGLWEVPVNQLFDLKTMGLKCTYLDQCLSHCHNGDDVRDLLLVHLQYVIRDHRAPVHINLRPLTLDSPIALDGIRKFLDHVHRRHDVWIVTMSQLMNWIKVPTRNSLLAPKHFWQCNKRVYIKCSERGKNTTVARVTLYQVMDVNKLLMWQTIFFVILFIVAYQYDKYSTDVLT